MEIFNEITILIVCHLMTTLLNVAMPDEFADTLGWIIIWVVVFNICSNLANISVEKVWDYYSYKKKQKLKHKSFALLQKLQEEG